MKNILFLLITIVLFIGCKDDESKNEILQPNSLALVTGINWVGQAGDQLGTYGNPNDKTSTNASLRSVIDSQPINIAIYPSITLNDITISTPEYLKSIWIVQGETSNLFQTLNFDSLFQKTQLDTTNINDLSKEHFKYGENGMNAHSIQLNLSGIESGFYKFIFETLEGELYWSTVLIKPEYTVNQLDSIFTK